jgi:hypothetical protein
VPSQEFIKIAFQHHLTQSTASFLSPIGEIRGPTLIAFNTNAIFSHHQKHAQGNKTRIFGDVKIFSLCFHAIKCLPSFSYSKGERKKGKEGENGIRDGDGGDV